MSKPIVKVFIVIGALLLCLIIWAFVFGGGIENVYNAIAEQVNTTWGNIVGDDSATILPEWNNGNDTTQNLGDGQDLIN